MFADQQSRTECRKIRGVSKCTNENMYKIRIILVALAVYYLLGLRLLTIWKSLLSKKEPSLPERVYRVGDDVPVAKPVVAEPTGPRSGADVYDAKCAMCHGAGVCWRAESRRCCCLGLIVLRKVKQYCLNMQLRDIKVALDSCLPKVVATDCSDEEVTEAVKHMLEISK